MVNYLYELDDIEKNHEAYAQQRTVVAANAVTRLARARGARRGAGRRVSRVLRRGQLHDSPIHRHDARRG